MSDFLIDVAPYNGELSFIKQTPSPIVIFPSDPTSAITIQGTKDGEWFKLYYDGRSECGPNYSPDQAAKDFWEAVKPLVLSALSQTRIGS